MIQQTIFLLSGTIIFIIIYNKYKELVDKIEKLNDDNNKKYLNENKEINDLKNLLEQKTAVSDALTLKIDEITNNLNTLKENYNDQANLITIDQQKIDDLKSLINAQTEISNLLNLQVSKLLNSANDYQPFIQSKINDLQTYLMSKIVELDEKDDNKIKTLNDSLTTIINDSKNMYDNKLIDLANLINTQIQDSNLQNDIKIQNLKTLVENRLTEITTTNTSSISDLKSLLQSQIAASASLDDTKIANLKSIVDQKFAALPDNSNLINTINTTLNTVQSAFTTESKNLIGSVSMFAGPNVPPNYALCDGAALLISDFPQLFAVIGKTYNNASTNASLYFNLPDLRNKFVRCLDTSNTQRTLGSYQQYLTAMPRNSFNTNYTGDHSHSCSTDGNHFHDTIWSNINMGSNLYTFTGSNVLRHWMNSGNSDSTTSSACGTSWNGNHSHTISTSGSHSHTVASGGDSETCPNNVTLYFIIRVK